MIIGLYGDSRCGKDTVAMIIESEGYVWRSFAGALRELLFQINPVIDFEDGITYQDALKHFTLDAVKKNFPESVELMIRLGQAARNIIHEDVWIWPVMRNLPFNTVISDVRQQNEYDAIMDAGGEVWKIVRPGTKPRAMDRLLDHNDFSVCIHNNGSLADLELVVKEQLKNAETGRT